ncbi:SGNH/GDSL hydrolase family protein [Jiella marina]|uniref:SGNH/GDSL hydrolase family protein n=1 Tax=Jiella sp. LLJ827 TaxID=2917712 RepID=UPI002100F994|nr:SGNH family hydrolase [Jiella sp. LLJ827]MCQ0988611.1 DUF459 domain-containing protein [Jiella sp. LLJ827]
MTRNWTKERGPTASRLLGVRGLGAMLLALALLLTSLPLASTPAEAQQRPRTILDMLFGNGIERRRTPQRIERRVIRREPAARERPRRASPSRSRKRAPAAPAPAPVETAKSDDAKTVLVVGDFMAKSLADGLREAYEDNEMVKIEASTSGSSGLVRQDHYDWSEELGPIIAEEEPAVVVMMIGSNDRQPMDTASGTLKLGTGEWNSEYERRVNEIASIVKGKNVPLVWVGAPSFKFDRMSEDMVFFNDLYRRAATQVSGEFVDIWEGFVDENGAFVYRGPSVDGQTVQLRNSDGITMTNAGDAKLAFFTKKVVDRFLGGAGGTRLSSEQLPSMQLPSLSNAASALRSPAIALDDPSLDGGETLLGGGSTVGFALERSPRDKLVLGGRGTGHVDGRADDFGWNDKAEAVTTEGSVAYSGSLNLNAVRAERGIKPPEEMPSILDAIVEDWTKENEAAQGGDTD